jgi:hypothetical protein
LPFSTLHERRLKLKQGVFLNDERLIRNGMLKRIKMTPVVDLLEEQKAKDKKGEVSAGW